jgi:hypothetical protein
MARFTDDDACVRVSQPVEPVYMTQLGPWIFFRDSYLRRKLVKPVRCDWTKPLPCLEARQE